MRPQSPPTGAKWNNSPRPNCVNRINAKSGFTTNEALPADELWQIDDTYWMSETAILFIGLGSGFRSNCVLIAICNAPAMNCAGPAIVSPGSRPSTVIQAPRGA